MDDNASIIKPYIKPNIVEKAPDVANAIAYELALTITRKRGNKKQNEKGESKRKHKDRVITSLQNYAGYFHLPPDSTAEIPKFPSIRYVFDEPISSLGDIQFLVKSPQYPN